MAISFFDVHLAILWFLDFRQIAQLLDDASEVALPLGRLGRSFRRGEATAGRGFFVASEGVAVEVSTGAMRRTPCARICRGAVATAEGCRQEVAPADAPAPTHAQALLTFTAHFL
jgi:hypothetical protein